MSLNLPKIKLPSYITKYDYDYFFGIPTGKGIYAWLALFFIMLVTTVALYLYFIKKGKIELPYKKFAKRFFWPNLTIAITGLILIFLRFESINYFSFRFWDFLLVFCFIALNIYFYLYYRGRLQDEIEEFHQKKRKEKWLPKKKKK